MCRRAKRASMPGARPPVPSSSSSRFTIANAAIRSSPFVEVRAAAYAAHTSRVSRVERSPNILFRLFVVGRLAGELLAPELAESGVTPWELAVHGALSAWGPMTPTELAHTVGLPPSTLSVHIRRMVEQGAVRR